MTLSLITATRDRAVGLATVALPSVLNQSDAGFEWIVVNDGADAETRSLLQSLRPACQLTYLELEHPQAGFGLCAARNLGLAVARGEWVAYLDDDNALEPGFVVSIQAFLAAHPSVRCEMVRQRRRRDVVGQGQILRRGQDLVAPAAQTGSWELVRQRELFDSNGFTHWRAEGLRWNPDYRVFADYEFFLQCLELWGATSFRLCQEVLVRYVQRSDGVIGRSSYGDWAGKRRRLVETAGVLSREDKVALGKLVTDWKRSIPVGVLRGVPLNFCN